MAMTMRCKLSKWLTVVCLWVVTMPLSAQKNQYVEDIEHRWMSMLPNIGVMQYAGNIGFMSAGFGWDYGKDNRWETHLLFGFLPHFTFDDDAMTVTIRQQLLPWQCRISDQFSVTPACFGASLNAVMNNEFWFTEPINNNYYRFSSKVRLHLGMGSRLNFYVPDEKKRRLTRISFYYEVSTYDLAVISYFRTSHTRLSELLSVGIGLNVSLY